jgi:multidrug efflux pump subunit AcrB
MAMAFVSGLASSTILTLLIVPVEYEALEKIKVKFKKSHNQ